MEHGTTLFQPVESSCTLSYRIFYYNLSPEELAQRNPLVACCVATCAVASNYSNHKTSHRTGRLQECNLDAERVDLDRKCSRMHAPRLQHCAKTIVSHLGANSLCGSIHNKIHPSFDKSDRVV